MRVEVVTSYEGTPAELDDVIEQVKATSPDTLDVFDDAGHPVD